MRTLIDCVHVLFDGVDDEFNSRPMATLHDNVRLLSTAVKDNDQEVTLELVAWITQDILRFACMKDLPLVEAMAELITAQQAGKTPDFAKVLEQHEPGEVAQPQDVFAQLERKWLEKHPRRWNALTPQSQQLLETMVDALLEETTAVEAEKTLVVLRDIVKSCRKEQPS